MSPARKSASPQGPRRQGLSPLGRPRPLHVACDETGLPARIQFPRSDHPVAVTDIDQVWRIAEEWWRETPLARTYYQLRLADGRALTCFHDESLSANESVAPNDSITQNAWFAQHY